MTSKEYSAEDLAKLDALGSWGDDSTTWDAASISIPEFTSLIEQAYILKRQVDALESQKEKTQEQLNNVNHKILDVLSKTNQTSFKTVHGTVVRNKRFSVRHPSDPAKKDAFFNYLQERGIFKNMVSVNSQTLSSWYRQELDAAVERGEVEFSVPGLDTPTYVEYITLRKG